MVEIDRFADAQHPIEAAAATAFLQDLQRPRRQTIDLPEEVDIEDRAGHPLNEVSARHVVGDHHIRLAAPVDWSSRD